MQHRHRPPDNPTAAEGRADEQHGDQHDDDRPTLAQATTYIKEAGTIIDLNSRFNEVSGFFEGDELLALTDDKADRAKALKGGK